jgi:hypothetical protein
MEEAEEYWYIEEGPYFGKRNYFYRITRNADMHSGEGDHDWDRFNQFGLEFEGWKKDGGHVVVCPPPVIPADFAGLRGWTKDTILKIRENTDRKIVMSRKPGKPIGHSDGDEFWVQEKLENLPISEALKGAHVLVTAQSNVMVKALLEGVPIICTSKNRKIGSIEQIENPIYERDWLKNLAYNQWTVAQMESGQAWEELNQWG